ncbi:Cohesin subunit scc-3 [Nosema granulosis]|uniref:Cohesin subunit scc-3 n=1 Tax=Nosema granulosis TaxID=83296 RepID=A0A9P6L044_9MICR|nr:Cohesin subunit scc-3 [Nosema granulosis]
MEKIEADECPLDIYTPEMIIENLKSKEECTEDILELIKKVQPNPIKLKKLSKIFTSLTNCDHIGITEVTRSKNRNLRLISTYLIFSKMCEWCKEGHDYETVSALYREVFLVRYRDVDPNIRALCVEFIGDWITISPNVFCTNNYLKYLGMYLNDKADIVRKKAVCGLVKLVEKKLDLQETISKNIKRIVEVGTVDKNTLVREEAKRLVLMAYNSGYISKEFVYQILKEDFRDNKLLNLALWNILKYEKEGNLQSSWKRKNYKFENESICGYYEGLHEIFKETSSTLKKDEEGASQGILKRLIFDKQDVEHLVQFTIKSYEENGRCCGEESNCYLKIIRLEKIKASQALCLFEAFKDEIKNIEIITEIVQEIPLESFKEEVEATIRLIELYFSYGFSNRHKLKDSPSIKKILEGFFALMKFLEVEFQSTVNIFIEQAQKDLFLRFFCVRFFDLSKFVEDEDFAETKLFASLWSTINKDYHFVDTMKLSKHVDLREVCELLLFINSKGGGMEYEEVCYDTETSLRRIFTKTKAYVKENINLLVNQESISYFLRFNEENVLTETVHLLFEVIQADTLKVVISKLKNRTNLVEEFFVYLDTDNKPDSSINISSIMNCTTNILSNIGESLLSETEKNLEGKNRGGCNIVDKGTDKGTVGKNLVEISKILGGKSKALKDGVVFKALKNIVEKKRVDLLDSVCVNFVSHLNANECIVLDSKLDACKLKNLLSKKIRGPVENLSSVMSENTTYL